MIVVWKNEATPVGAPTPARGLNPLLDCTERGLAMKATRVCSVAPCAAPVKARGLCNRHYLRQRKHGDPATVLRAANGTFGPVCVVPECGSPHHTGGYCGKHAYRIRVHGTPAAPAAKTGPQNPAWRGDVVGYSAVHARLRRTFGPAATQLCDCGAPAEQWAYDHSDPAEQEAPEGPYSTDLARYRPMCVPCHKRADLARFAPLTPAQRARREVARAPRPAGQDPTGDEQKQEDDPDA